MRADPQAISLQEADPISVQVLFKIPMSTHTSGFWDGPDRRLQDQDRVQAKVKKSRAKCTFTRGKAQAGTTTGRRDRSSRVGSRYGTLPVKVKK